MSSVTATIDLLDLYTGETKTIRYDSDSYDSINWQWTEGNYSCDCNRWSEFFGDDPPAADDFCGEPRIRAKANLPEGMSFNDWPQEEDREFAANDMRRLRSIIRQRPDMAL